MAMSCRYVVGVCGAVAFHSLVQLLISGLRLMQRSPVILSRSHAWLIFAGDQVDHAFLFLHHSVERLKFDYQVRYIKCVILSSHSIVVFRGPYFCQYASSLLDTSFYFATPVS